jgi:hypothetical protein
MPTAPDNDGSKSEPTLDPTKKTWQDNPAATDPAATDPAAGEPAEEPADGVVSPDKKTWQ